MRIIWKVVCHINAVCRYNIVVKSEKYWVSGINMTEGKESEMNYDTSMMGISAVIIDKEVYSFSMAGPHPN